MDWLRRALEGAKRYKTAGVSTVGALTLVGAAFALNQVDPPAGPCFDVPELGVVVCQADAVTTTTVAATTTTAAPTTTTAAPTTTTTAAPTTTTAQPGTVPPTQSPGVFSKANAYRFDIDDLNNGFDWWSAPYFYDLPYQDGYGWAPGDRLAYRCMFGFLIQGGTKINTGINDQQDLQGGELVGRFAVVRNILSQTGDPNGGAYIRVNDTYMTEGARTFDGTHVQDYGAGQSDGLSLCGSILTHDYEPYLGPSQDPVILFWHNGQVVEKRDYSTVDQGIGVKFQLVDDGSETGIPAVQAYGPDNEPGAIVYYYPMGNGQVTAFLP